MSSMVTLAASGAAARPTLAHTITLQLSPGTHPSQGQHCHMLKKENGIGFKLALKKKKQRLNEKKSSVVLKYYSWSFHAF